MRKIIDINKNYMLTIKNNHGKFKMSGGDIWNQFYLTVREIPKRQFHKGDFQIACMGTDFFSNDCSLFRL